MLVIGSVLVATFLGVPLIFNFLIVLERRRLLRLLSSSSSFGRSFDFVADSSRTGSISWLGISFVEIILLVPAMKDAGSLKYSST